MTRWSAMAAWLVDGTALTPPSSVALALALVASSGWCVAGVLPRPRRTAGRPFTAATSPVGDGADDTAGAAGPAGSRRAARSARALALAVAALVVPVVILAAPVLLVMVPAVPLWRWWRRRRTVAEHRRDICDGLPDAVDVLAVGVNAGLSLRAGLSLVVRFGPDPVAAEIATVLDRQQRGMPLADALVELDERSGGATGELVRVLRDGDRYGVALTTTMRELVDDARRERRQRAAERTRQLPVRMLFPLVLCILPAFVLLTVAPVVLDALRTVR